jgi:predicted phosphodiesterase
MSVLVVHGSVSSINQFVFSSSEEAVFLEQFSFSNTDLVIGGHSGNPFTKKIGKKVWHNSGAIGMPANDGSPNTWYSLISPQNHGLKIEHKVLIYDHNSTYSAMKENNLHNGYAKGLISGLWPSTDILPSKERLSSGMKIEEGSYFTH